MLRPRAAGEKLKNVQSQDLTLKTPGRVITGSDTTVRDEITALGLDKLIDTSIVQAFDVKSTGQPKSKMEIISAMKAEYGCGDFELLVIGDGSTEIEAGTSESIKALTIVLKSRDNAHPDIFRRLISFRPHVVVEGPAFGRIFDVIKAEKESDTELLGGLEYQQYIDALKQAAKSGAAAKEILAIDGGPHGRGGDLIISDAEEDLSGDSRFALTKTVLLLRIRRLVANLRAQLQEIKARKDRIHSDRGLELKETLQNGEEFIAFFGEMAGKIERDDINRPKLADIERRMSEYKRRWPYLALRWRQFSQAVKNPKGGPEVLIDYDVEPTRKFNVILVIGDIFIRDGGILRHVGDFVFEIYADRGLNIKSYFPIGQTSTDTWVKYKNMGISQVFLGWLSGFAGKNGIKSITADLTDLRNLRVFSKFFADEMRDRNRERSFGVDDPLIYETKLVLADAETGKMKGDFELRYLGGPARRYEVVGDNQDTVVECGSIVTIDKGFVYLEKGQPVSGKEHPRILIGYAERSGVKFFGKPRIPTGMTHYKFKVPLEVVLALSRFFKSQEEPPPVGTGAASQRSRSRTGTERTLQAGI